MIPGWFKNALLVTVLPSLYLQGLEWIFRREFAVIDNNGIVILSGTSSGIGRAACGHLADRYPRVDFYCGIRQESDAKGYPFTLDNVTPVQLDVTKDNDVENVMGLVKQSGKPLIGLIHNAGVNALGTIEFLPLSEYQWMLDVNVLGTLRLTKAALPFLRRHEKGSNSSRIVLVTSMSARVPAPSRFGGYVASKYALEALGDSLRQEVAPFNISVSIVEPGVVPSKMANGISNDFVDGNNKDVEAKRIYPHVYNERKSKEFLFVFDTTHLSALDTCEGIEDAMFNKHPKTRYITSKVGSLPSWLLVRVAQLSTDRMGDWMYDNILCVLIVVWKSMRYLLGSS